MGKEERKPVSHTFTDKEGEFVFGPLCPGKEYAIQIWVDDVKHVKVCAKTFRDEKCLKGVKLEKCDHELTHCDRPHDDECKFKEHDKPHDDECKCKEHDECKCKEHDRPYDDECKCKEHDRPHDDDCKCKEHGRPHDDECKCKDFDECPRKDCDKKDDEKCEKKDDKKDCKWNKYYNYR